MRVFTIAFSVIIAGLFVANVSASTAYLASEQAELMKSICSKFSVSSDIGCCRVTKIVRFIGLTVLAFVVSFIIIPLICCACGFRRVGVRGDSYAARYQSVHGETSCFSCLQSITMAGCPHTLIFLISIVVITVVMLYFNKSCV